MADAPARPHVALVGGDTLLARELRDLLSGSKPAPRIELISANAENLAVLGLEDEEAVVMSPLQAASLEGAQVAFLVGSPASSRRALTYSEPENVADISQGRGSSHRVFSSTTNIRIPESHRENGRITQSSAFISVGKPRAGKMLYALYPPLSG